MARLANISGKEAVKAFEKAGWQGMGQVGGHLVVRKQGRGLNDGGGISATALVLIQVLQLALRCKV